MINPEYEIYFNFEDLLKRFNEFLCHRHLYHKDNIGWMLINKESLKVLEFPLILKQQSDGSFITLASEEIEEMKRYLIEKILNPYEKAQNQKKTKVEVKTTMKHSF
jgi:hypothetical protein